jgi:hypothetical protein
MLRVGLVALERFDVGKQGYECKVIRSVGMDDIPSKFKAVDFQNFIGQFFKKVFKLLNVFFGCVFFKFYQNDMVEHGSPLCEVGFLVPIHKWSFHALSALNDRKMQHSAEVGLFTKPSIKNLRF